MLYFVPLTVARGQQVEIAAIKTTKLVLIMVIIIIIFTITINIIAFPYVDSNNFNMMWTITKQFCSFVVKSLSACDFSSRIYPIGLIRWYYDKFGRIEYQAACKL